MNYIKYNESKEYSTLFGKVIQGLSKDFNNFSFLNVIDFLANQYHNITDKSVTIEKEIGINGETN